MLTTATCDKLFPRPECVCVSMLSASIMSQLTGQAVTTGIITITRPHLTTQFAWYLSTHAGFSYMSPLVDACSLFPANYTAAALLIGVLPMESCFVGQSVERRPTAMSIIDY